MSSSDNIEDVADPWPADYLTYEKNIEERHGCFSSDARYVRSHGNAVLKPVENIVFSALLWPILVSPSYFRREFPWVGLPLIVGATAAVTCQILAIYYVFDFLKDSNQKKCDQLEGATFLRIICTIVLTALVFSELRDSVNFCRWTLRLPEWTKGRFESLKEHIEFLERYETGFVLEKKLFKILKSKQKPDGVECKVNHIYAGGVSSNYKFVMIVMGVVKGGIEISLLACGSGYIFYANKNEIILLNAVSLLFILAIDDYMYKCLATDLLKRFISNETPTISLLRGEKSVVGKQHFVHNPKYNKHLHRGGVWFTIVAVCATVFIVWLSWCVHD